MPETISFCPRCGHLMDNHLELVNPATDKELYVCSLSYPDPVDDKDPPRTVYCVCRWTPD